MCVTVVFRGKLAASFGALQSAIHPQAIDAKTPDHVDIFDDPFEALRVDPRDPRPPADGVMDEGDQT